MKNTIFILAAALVGTNALADTRLALEQMDNSSEMVINVQKGKVAFEEDGTLIAIYDAKDGSITQVDHKGKSYMVVDAATMDEVASQMSAMMKEMEKQLAAMPPAQREAMMEMMPGMAGAMGGDKTVKPATVEWTGQKEKVAGYGCKVATVTTGEGVVSKACIAKASTLGIPEDDFEAMTDMFESMQKMAARFGSDPQLPDAKAMGGMPIRMVDADGKVSQLKSVSTEDLDSTMFEIPASYTKRSITDNM